MYKCYWQELCVHNLDKVCNFNYNSVPFFVFNLTTWNQTFFLFFIEKVTIEEIINDVKEGFVSSYFKLSPLIYLTNER